MPLKLPSRERSHKRSRGSSANSDPLNKSQESNVLASLRQNYNEHVMMQ